MRRIYPLSLYDVKYPGGVFTNREQDLWIISGSGATPWARLNCRRQAYVLDFFTRLQKGAGERALMTAVDVVFRYGNNPGEREMRALDNVWEVYGIRRVQFNEGEKTIRVEYDATRMNEDVVAGLLRRAGIDVREKLSLA